MEITWFVGLCLLCLVFIFCFGYLADCTNVPFFESKYKFCAKKYRKAYVRLFIIGLLGFAISMAGLTFGATLLLNCTPETTVNSVTTSVVIDTTKGLQILREHQEDKEYYTISGFVETTPETDGYYPIILFNSNEINGIGLFSLKVAEEFRFVSSDEIRFEVTEETAVYRPNNILRNLFYYKMNLTVYTLYAPEEVVQDVVMIEYQKR